MAPNFMWVTLYKSSGMGSTTQTNTGYDVRLINLVVLLIYAD